MFHDLCVVAKVLGIARYTWRSFKVMKSVERLAQEERERNEAKAAARDNRKRKKKKKHQQKEELSEEVLEKEIIRKYRIQEWKRKELKLVSQYWIVFAALSIWDDYADQFARFIPFYYTLKFALLSFLFFPQLNGPENIYHEFVYPILSNELFQITFDGFLISLWEYTNALVDLIVEGPGKLAVNTKNYIVETALSVSSAVSQFKTDVNNTVTETNNQIYRSMSHANQRAVDRFHATTAAIVAVPVAIVGAIIAFPGAVLNQVTEGIHAVKMGIQGGIESAVTGVSDTAQAIEDSIDSAFESVRNGIVSRVQHADNAIKSTWPLVLFFNDRRGNNNLPAGAVEMESNEVAAPDNAVHRKPRKKVKAKRLLARVAGVQDPNAFEKYEKKKREAELAAAEATAAAEEAAAELARLEAKQKAAENSFLGRVIGLGGYFSNDEKDVSGVARDETSIAENGGTVEAVASAKAKRRSKRRSIRRRSKRRGSVDQDNEKQRRGSKPEAVAQEASDELARLEAKQKAAETSFLGRVMDFGGYFSNDEASQKAVVGVLKDETNTDDAAKEETSTAVASKAKRRSKRRSIRRRSKRRGSVDKNSEKQHRGSIEGVPKQKRNSVMRRLRDRVSDNKTDSKNQKANAETDHPATVEEENVRNAPVAAEAQEKGFFARFFYGDNTEEATNGTPEPEQQPVADEHMEAQPTGWFAGWI